MDCDFSPSSPHLLPNGLFSPQNRISFELLALSGLSGFSTFKGGKMLIFQGFANSRIVREFPPFSFKVRIWKISFLIGTTNFFQRTTASRMQSISRSRHRMASLPPLQKRWTQFLRSLCRRIKRITNIYSTGAMTLQSGITAGFAALWTMSTGTRTSTSI